MKPLFAPWRIEYVKRDDDESDDCVFCVAPNGGDEENLILARGEMNYVIMNNYPYNPGHVMIIPYRHVNSIESLERGELHEHYELVQRMTGVLRGVFEPHGFNVGCNLGGVAGAGIAEHLHTHIVPRWQGDTNFMPVISDTQVIVEELRESYKQIREHLK